MQNVFTWLTINQQTKRYSTNEEFVIFAE